MDGSPERIAALRPRLIRRTGGGWLAVSPRGACFSMGVTAPTEQEAIDEFRYAFCRWLEILDQKGLDVPK